MKKIFLVIVLLIAVFTTIAQPLCQIEHFTVNNGLAQGVVTTILQDKKGFIWFSTWNGLDKFDGYTFKNYKAFPGDGCMLSNNRITFIAESRSGDIWCQTYDGHIFLFDTKEEKFISILTPIEKKPGIHNCRPNLCAAQRSRVGGLRQRIQFQNRRKTL